MKNSYIFFFSSVPTFYVPSADPPKYYYLVGFLRFGNHDQFGPLYDPMSSTPNTYPHPYLHAHICYILFIYFIVILLYYYILPITYYRCGGSVRWGRCGGRGVVRRARWYFYIGDIYDRVKDLLSISGLSVSSFAPTTYYIYIVFLLPTTITYIPTRRTSIFLVIPRTFVYMCVCNTSQSVLFMLARKPPNNNITTVMRAVPSYIHISVLLLLLLLHSVYYYIVAIFV